MHKPLFISAKFFPLRTKSTYALPKNNIADNETMSKIVVISIVKTLSPLTIRYSSFSSNSDKRLSKNFAAFLGSRIKIRFEWQFPTQIHGLEESYQIS